MWEFPAFKVIGIVALMFVGFFSAAQALTYQQIAAGQQGKVLGASTPTPVTGTTCLGTGYSCSMTWTFTAGDFVAVGGCTVNGTTLAIASSPSLTWNLAVSHDDGARDECALWYSQNVPGGATTMTITTGNSAIGVDGGGEEYSGIAAANALDVTSFAAPFNTASFYSGTTNTTNQANEVAIGFAGARSSTTWAATGGYTARQTTNDVADHVSTNLSDQILSSTGSQQATWTIGSANSGDALVATFLASGGGNNNPPPITPPGTSTSTPVTNNRIFYIAANGSDASNGTSKATPWLHAPGMPNCAATCAATTPQPGDSYIFRGGDTWGMSSLPWTWVWSGSAGDNIYIGVDKTWYAGSAWARPMLYGGNPPSSAQLGSCPVNDDGLTWLKLNYDSYVTFDNFEFTGQCWTTDNIATALITFGGSANNLLIENNYVHGWSHTVCAVQGSGCDSNHMFEGGAGNTSDVGVQIVNNVFDGSDTDKASGFAIGFGGYDIHGNVFRYMSNFAVLNNIHTFHDNLLEYKVLTYDSGGVNQDHGNSYEENSEYPSGAAYVYNNVFRHNEQPGDGGDVNFWGNPPAGNTEWIFNNVFYDDNAEGGNYFLLSSASGLPTVHILNNTFQIGGSRMRITETATAPTFQNMHIIGDNGTTLNSNISLENSSVVTDNGNGVYQLTAAAAAQGYAGSQTFAYSPLVGGATIGAGANLSSLCVGELAPLCQDTTFAVSYDAVNHIAVFPARMPVARPASGSWDVGAYQYSSGGGNATPPAPPTGVQVN